MGLMQRIRIGTCELCGAVYSEPHNWVYEVVGNRYRCTGCNATTTSSPGTILKDPDENELQSSDEVLLDPAA